MALADTARLISSLELQDKFSATASKFDRTVGQMDRRTQTLDRIGTHIGQGIRNTAQNLGRLAVIGGGVIASQVAIGVRSLGMLEEVQNQTAAVIKSTESAANVSAEAIRTQAEALEDLSTVDDKVIQAGQNMLLTFTNIRDEVGEGNDIFTQATETLLDLSVAMGTEPKQAAIQLGKALNDPIRGITALRRVGVTFTEQQEQQIKKMVESGRILDAQKVIIRELNREFGGSAEAFGKGPAATMRRFGDAVEGAQQALATGFLPLMEKVSARVQEALGDPKVLAGIKSFGESAAAGVEQLINIGTKLPWDSIASAARVMGQGAKALLDAFTSLPPWIQTAVLTGWGLNKLTGGALGGLAGTLFKGLMPGGGLRGATPATPLFTKEVGIGGAAGGAAGGLGLAGGLLLAGGAGATAGGGLMALDDLNKAIKEGSAEGVKEGVLDFTGGFPGLIGKFVQDTFFPTGPKPTSPQSATPLGQFDPTNRGGTRTGPVPVNVTNPDAISERSFNQARADQRTAFAQLGLELRLIRDKSFKPDLTQAEFLKILARTSEFGAKGVGTKIERGEKTGEDPVGDAFVALVKRLPKNLLTGEVYREVANHIVALEEVQEGLIEDGNFKAANHAQRNIDKLSALIGAVDRTRPILERTAERTSALSARMTEAREATRSGFQASNAQLGVIAGKNFSPTVNVATYVTSNVTISDIQRKITSQQIAIGRGPLEFAGTP